MPNSFEEKFLEILFVYFVENKIAHPLNMHRRCGRALSSFDLKSLDLASFQKLWFEKIEPVE